MPKKRITNEFCRICQGPNATSSFGAISCLACGAFFRRLAILGISYDCICSRLENLSEIEDKKLILRCKGCRLEKCLQAGMKRDLVQAIHLKAFHKERKQLMAKMEEVDSFSNEQDGFSNLPQNVNVPMENAQTDHLPFTSCFSLNFSEKTLLENLLRIELAIGRIHLSCTGHDWNYLEQFESLEQLATYGENLLDHPERFSSLPLPAFPMANLKMLIQREGISCRRRRAVFDRHTRLAIDFAKTLPVFGQLQLKDKICLIKNFTIVAELFLLSFYSLAQNSRTMLLPYKTVPVELFSVPRYASDKILQKMARRIYTEPVERVLRVVPGKEEFILLLAMAFLNGSASSLSSAAQELLDEEAEKYAKILLRFEQSKLGEQAGALRYQQVLQLLWGAIGDAAKYREFCAYLECIHERAELCGEGGGGRGSALLALISQGDNLFL